MNINEKRGRAKPIDRLAMPSYGIAAIATAIFLVSLGGLKRFFEKISIRDCCVYLYLSGDGCEFGCHSSAQHQGALHASERDLIREGKGDDQDRQQSCSPPI
jgi:hypothetical protein